VGVDVAARPRVSIRVCFCARSGRHGGGKASSPKPHHSRVCFRVQNGGPGGGNPLNTKTRPRRGPVLKVGIEVVARSRAQKHTNWGVVSCSKWASRQQKGFGFENTLIGA